MSLKQFRVRDVLINLPFCESQADCAESPSRIGCIDGESLLISFPFPQCIFTPIVCEPGPTVCNEAISPYVKVTDCREAMTRLDIQMPLRTPVIDGVNIPRVLHRIASAADLPALVQELRHVETVVREYMDAPESTQAWDLAEQQLLAALDEVRQRKQRAAQE